MKSNKTFTWLRKPLSRGQMIASMGSIFGSLLAGAGYGFGIEPRRPVAESVKLMLNDFPGLLRAVHIADLHMHQKSRFMACVAKMINSFDPDFIFLTGDLVEHEDELPGCIEWLKELKCKFCTYFVLGNWEHWSGTLRSGIISKLQSIGIKTLYNSGETIDWNGGRFFIAGIDCAHYGKPEPRLAFKTHPKDICTIALSHAPAGIEHLIPFNPDLVLSGHTHGGQVRIPGIGALKTPPASGRFEQGLYQVSSTKLYVNRGIGTSIYPVKFLCPPEVTHLAIAGSK